MSIFLYLSLATTVYSGMKQASKPEAIKVVSLVSGLDARSAQIALMIRQALKG